MRDQRFLDEARDAYERRYQAHPMTAPVELWTLRDAAGFLLGLAFVVLALVLVLATGRYGA